MSGCSCSSRSVDLLTGFRRRPLSSDVSTSGIGFFFDDRLGVLSVLDGGEVAVIRGPVDVPIVIVDDLAVVGALPGLMVTREAIDVL